MTDKIFIEIDKFDLWAQSHFGVPQKDLRGEWECNYDYWDDIYKSFEIFIRASDPGKLTSIQKDRLLYIIARDNESEYLSNILESDFLIILAEHSLYNGSTDDKWQLATQLYKLTNKTKALNLLEKFVNDEDEYVSRRSLIELAKLQSDKVEFYVKKFWFKEKYADMEEYQKIAALHSLKIINSNLLDHYIELAMHSGQKYLIDNANQIATQKNCL